jgi:hypothetical protein
MLETFDSQRIHTPEKAHESLLTIKRSPETKRLLSDALDPDMQMSEIEMYFNLTMKSDYSKPDEKEMAQKRLKEAKTLMEEFIPRLRQFQEQADQLSDEVFQEKFLAFRDELDTIGLCYFQYKHVPYWRNQDTAYPSYFADIRNISSAQEFVERRALQWRPQREEIARILAIAQSLKKENPQQNAEGIKMLDIGGGNAVLGKLIIDFAREQGIHVEYTIVDPDQHVVEQAQSIFADEMKFFPIGVSDFVEEMYKDNTEIQTLLQKRKRLLIEDRVRYQDLAQICEKIGYLKQYKLAIDSSLLEDFKKSWEQDFYSTEEIPSFDPEVFKTWVYGQEEQFHYKTLFGRWFLARQKDIAQITKEIEKKVGDFASPYDLVLNSWMPHEMDFTADIRFLNGSGILYATARDGSTGIQNMDSGYVMHSREPALLGEEESYGVGENYKMHCGWVGRSLFETRDVPFCNGIIVEVKKTHPSYQDGEFSIESFSLGEEYPWSPVPHKKTFSPIVPVREQGDGENYRADLRILAGEMEKTQGIF